jgi:hypothetical protein
MSSLGNRCILPKRRPTRNVHSIGAPCGHTHQGQDSALVGIPYSSHTNTCSMHLVVFVTIIDYQEAKYNKLYKGRGICSAMIIYHSLS